MLQTLALKIGIALAIVAGACGATWFAADSHYSQQYAALKAGYEQASRDQKAQVDRTIAENAAAAKDIDVQAQQQIGSMAGTITSLLMRKPAGGSAITVCATAPSAPVAAVQSDRPAAAASNPAPAAAAGPDIGIARDTLAGALDVGLDALRADVLFREYLRRTGQVKP